MSMLLPLPVLLGLLFGLSEAGLGLLKRSPDSSVDADERSLRLLWTTILLAVGAALYAAARLPEAAMGGGGLPLAVGVTLFTLGTALRWYAIFYLGRFFSVNVAIHARHEVVDTGPYRRIRHPSYLGALLAFYGLAVCMGNWVSLVLLALPVTWAFERRIRIEEHALANALGFPYRSYMQRTKRLLPLVY